MTDEVESVEPKVEPLDPEKASETIEELCRLDHALKEHGSSLAVVLRHAASSATGIKV